MSLATRSADLQLGSGRVLPGAFDMVVGSLVGLGIGLLIAIAGYSPTYHVLAFAVPVLIVLAFVSVLMRTETIVVTLVGSVIFHNYLAVDIGFTILPAYAVVIVALMRMLPNRAFSSVWTPVNAPLKLWAVAAVVSVPVAFRLGETLPASSTDVRFTAIRPVVQLVVLLTMLGSFYVVVVVLSRRRNLFLTSVKVLLASATAVSVYALYQQLAYYVGLPTLAFLGESRPVPQFSLIGSMTVYRSPGTFAEPLNLGHFLIGTLSLSIAFYGHRALPGRFGRWIGVLVLVQGLALVSTFSTGAFTGMLGAVLVFILVGKRRVFTSLLVGLIAWAAMATGTALLSALAPASEATAPQLVSRRAIDTYRIETLPESASNPYIGFRRSDYWRASVQMATEHPWTGVGLGNFGAAAVALNPRLVPEAGSYGAVWGILGELGFPGLAIFVFFTWRFLTSLLTRYRKYAEAHPELLGFLAGSIGMLVQYFASGYTRLDIHFWVYAGLAMAAVRLATGNRTLAEKSMNRRARVPTVR